MSSRLDLPQRVRIRDSWGTSWANGGYGWMSHGHGVRHGSTGVSSSLAHEESLIGRAAGKDERGGSALLRRLDQERGVSESVGEQEKGRHVKAQEVPPTSHWAILSASPMLHAPSPFTSQSALSGIVEQIGRASCRG